MRVENSTNDQEQTQPHTENLNSKSHVWDHFKVLNDKVHAECQICQKKGKNVVYKFYDTTSNMIYHLNVEHGITKSNPKDYVRMLSV